MGEVPLDEVKRVLKPVTGAEGIRKRKQLRGLTKDKGCLSYTGPGRKEHQSECQKGKGVGRHEDSRQEARLVDQCQTTGRGPAAGL